MYIHIECSLIYRSHVYYVFYTSIQELHFTCKFTCAEISKRRSLFDQLVSLSNPAVGHYKEGRYHPQSNTSINNRPRTAQPKQYHIRIKDHMRESYLMLPRLSRKGRAKPTVRMLYVFCSNAHDW